MNFLDKSDLEVLLPATRREELLFEAWTDCKARINKLNSIWMETNTCDKVTGDLGRIKEALDAVRPLAEKATEAWFDKDKNQPIPKADSLDTEEQTAFICFQIAELFNHDIMDFKNADALLIAEEQSAGFLKMTEEVGNYDI